MNGQAFTIPCPGYHIAADWYENGYNKEIVLILPGYTSSKKRYADFVKNVTQKSGASALVVDYSGHGESPFELDDTSPAQHFLEVIYAFDWLRTRYPKANISVIGTSYGGFHAAHLAKYRNFKSLVLRTPAMYQPADFYSIQARIDREYTTSVFRKNTKAIMEHPLFAQPTMFTGSTLLVVHERDEDVPTQTTDIYAKAFDAEVYIAKGFKHSTNNPKNPQSGLAEYYDAITQWLRKSSAE